MKHNMIDKKLFENPDKIYDKENDRVFSWSNDSYEPFVFGFYKNKLYIKKYGIHASLYNDYIDYFDDKDKYKAEKSPRFVFKYPGRLWKDLKIISFWEYPPKDVFKKIIDQISKKIKENIYSSEWRIEVIKDKETSNIITPFTKKWNVLELPENQVTDLIPVTSYIGSKSRSKEELAIQHLDTSKKHEVPYGYGSKNPKYLPKRQWQMAAVTDECKEEDLYPRLFETPDYLVVIDKKGIKQFYWFDETPSYSFNFDNNDNARVGSMYDTHHELEQGRHSKYSGRIFTDFKIISFWYYPPKEKLKSLIKSLENKLHIKIWDDPEYKVEIIPDLKAITPDESGYKKTDRDDWANLKFPKISSHESNEYRHIYIPLKDYTGSKQRSKEELSIQHLDMKHKHEVPFGYGSKNPKYQSKRQWQMASATDESFYPNIKEGVADKYAKNKFHILDPDTKFDIFYNNKEIKNKDGNKIILKITDELFITKNPTSLNNFQANVKAVVSKSGDLYVLNSYNYIHDDFVKDLVRINELENNEKWWLKTPTNFLTLQRKGKTNTFLLGESNEPMIKNLPADRREYYDLPSFKTCEKIYDNYLNIARKFHPNFNFENRIFSPGDMIYEGAAMDKYMYRTFGIAPNQDYIGENDSRVVAVIDTIYRGFPKKIPIIKNPKNLNEFDNRVRAISDKKGNLYVALNEGEFNHGLMGNTLINKGIINTIWYNEDANNMEDYKGIYDDQKNFLLLNRNRNTDTFYESDTFIWEGDHSINLIKALKLKNPQFKYDIYAYNKYMLEFPGDKRFIDESLILESPDNFDFIDDIHYSPNNNTGKTLSFEVILNNETNTIEDVLIASRPNVYHGYDKMTNGPIKGQPGDNVSYDIPTLKYDFPWERIYPGRLFMKPKVITFWVYPSVSEMKDIIKIINKKLKINMINNGWYIEVYEEGIKRKGQQTYKNNYNRKDNSSFVPLSEYVGSKKPPEEEYLQHLDTKHKHEVPYGYGSKNPKYQTKRQWQMAAVTDEGKKEELYPKLFENPDIVKLRNGDNMIWKRAPNYPFGIFPENNKVYIGDVNDTHVSIVIPYDEEDYDEEKGVAHNVENDYHKYQTIERHEWNFPGRIWPTKKLISFWTYPNQKTFKKIINVLSKRLNLDIWNDKWKVEVIVEKKSKKIEKRGNLKNYAEGLWDQKYGTNYKISHISPIKYIGSKPRSKEELAIQHLDTKHKHEVPYGYGSKNPKYQTKRQWQMASVTDESTE